MQATTLKSKINHSYARAIKWSRESLGLTRIELAQRLNLSPKAIEKYESGRAIIDEEKIQNVLIALNLKREEFEKIRKGKGNKKTRKLKTVFTNSDRRSYKKIITKEVMALKSIRISKYLSQDQASAVCGYSRPTIGHIENGRIEVSVDRINFILKCYGATYAEFEVYLKSEEQKYEIQDRCIKKLKRISDDKLKILQTILEGF